FSGDNVLGVGTTVIPNQSGDLGQYLASLARLLELAPRRIYPAHGPVIEDGPAKLREYIAHRHERERQILAVLERGPAAVPEIVKVVYAAYPEALHAAAAQSTHQHLGKLEAGGRVACGRRRRDGRKLVARDGRKLVARVTHPIAAQLASPDPEARRAACVAAPDDPSAVLLAGALAAVLGDPVKAVARAASDALVAIGRRSGGVKDA